MTQPNNVIELPGFHNLVFGKHGTFVANRKDIYVGGALISYGEFSESETEFFQSVVDKDTTVVEIGANIGAHTVWLAKNAKRVIAVEPQPFIFYTLCAQVVLNSLQNVECINAAIGIGDSYIEIPRLDYSQDFNYGGVEIRYNTPYKVPVPLISLDNLCAGITGKVFLKIDVEGMEQEVIESGKEFITRTKPIMYVENDRNDKAAGLMKCIEDLGYSHTKHTPFLFNEKNHFNNSVNKFANLASFNEICTPK